jgi:hypothetical protein
VDVKVARNIALRRGNIMSKVTDPIKCHGKYSVGFDTVKCTNWIPKGQKLCESCLLHKFELDCRYDSEDSFGMSPMYDEDDVVMALRKASGL